MINNDDLKIVLTDDGSHTIYSKQFDSTYHSTHGAIQESKHIFINAGLKYLIQQGFKKSTIHILEIGFGTGLNALLSMQFAYTNQISIDYTSLEAYPLAPKMAAQLNYIEKLNIADSKKAFLRMHDQSTFEKEKLTTLFTLNKYNSKFEAFDYGVHKFDLIYFDPFDFNTESTFWEFDFLKRLNKSLKTGSLILSYGAKGSFKRDLKRAGFDIESIPGPPGKREVTRGVKKGLET